MMTNQPQPMMEKPQGGMPMGAQVKPGAQQGKMQLSEDQKNVATAVASTISAAMFNQQILSKALQLAKSSQKPVPAVARVIAQVAIKSIDDINEKVPVKKEAVMVALSQIAREFFAVMTQAGLAPEGDDMKHKAFLAEILKAVYDNARDRMPKGQKPQVPAQGQMAPSQQGGAMQQPAPQQPMPQQSAPQQGAGLIGGMIDSMPQE